MNSVLNLKTVKVGETVSNDYIYIQSYKEIPYGDGSKSFISGTATNQGASLAIKIWDANLINIFKENDISGNIVGVTGTVKEYKGAIELNVQGVDFNPACTDKSLFLKSVDVDKVFKDFADFLNSNISENGIRLIMGIFQGESLFDRFKVEYAGSKMHDAQIGGLMNHELKMLRIAKTLIENDERIGGNVKLKDLLFIGIVFHDIGKVHELANGTYTENSYVTHIMFSLEILIKYREAIIDLYGENFYYQLLAIIQGHHGEFGDKPRTPFAYIVHLIDMLESKTTSVLDKYDSGTAQRSETGTAIYNDHGDMMYYPDDSIMNYKG